MRGFRVTAVCAAVLLPTLAGCGGSSPPFAVSCTVTRMPWGALQASVTVTNSTSSPGPAIVYGPAVSLLRYVHPVLNPTHVVVQPAHGTVASYFGYIVPNVRPHHPTRLLMRFNLPHSAQSLNVTTTRTIQASDLSVVDNPNCTIGSSS